MISRRAFLKAAGAAPFMATVESPPGKRCPVRSSSTAEGDLFERRDCWQQGDEIVSLAFSQDSRTLAVATNYRVTLYDVVTSLPQLSFDHDGLVREIAYSHDGSKLAVVGGRWSGEPPEVHVWNPTTGREQAALQGHRGTINCVAFSPDDRILATGSSDRTVRLWDINSGGQTAELVGHKDWIRCLAFSPDGRTLATGSQDSDLSLWDVATGSHLATTDWHGNGVTGAVFSPDGESLFTSSFDGMIYLSNPALLCLPTTLPRQRGDRNAVLSLALSPDGRTLAAGASNDEGPVEVTLWNPNTGVQRGVLRGHRGHVCAVAFSPCGHLLASGGSDETVRLWAAQSSRSHLVCRLSHDHGCVMLRQTNSRE